MQDLRMPGRPVHAFASSLTWPHYDHQQKDADQRDDGGGEGDDGEFPVLEQSGIGSVDRVAGVAGRARCCGFRSGGGGMIAL